MLERIECDKFNEQIITFHNGLNVVLGDDIASNSIGKSTLLMIIDFVFGGSDYIKTNSDAREQLGEHSFKFIFNFNGEKLFFIRSTNNCKIVSICNESFQQVREITLSDYTRILQKKYDCELYDTSFREIVGRYFRVYGKDNLSEKKPLKYYDRESFGSSINTLIKLFNQYKIISEYQEEIEELDNKKTILTEATKKNLIPTVTSSIFKKNKDKIVELQKELENLKKNVLASSASIEAVISEEILALRNRKSQYIIEKNILNERKKRVIANLENNKIDLSPEFKQFCEYFKDINLEKIEKVDAFHTKLTEILKSELKASSTNISNIINEINRNINEIDEKILCKLNINDAPKHTINKIVEISASIKQLEEENGYFSKIESIKGELKKKKLELGDKKINILQVISGKINEKMESKNEIIYNKERRSPTISLEENRYDFKTEGDTGTGTAFANLITFDLALLDLTCLPAVSHDLPLLKNIENSAMKKIIELYNCYHKQIFISIDKINTYDDETVKIVNENSVIKLTKDQTLFIKNWKSNKQQ